MAPHCLQKPAPAFQSLTCWLVLLHFYPGCWQCTLRPRLISPTGRTWAPALPRWRSTEQPWWLQLLMLSAKLTIWPALFWASVSCTPSLWEWTLLTSRYTSLLLSCLWGDIIWGHLLNKKFVVQSLTVKVFLDKLLKHTAILQCNHWSVNLCEC